MSTFGVREALLTALLGSAEQPAWHPALAQALDGVSAAQAAWRPAEGRNSIREIVRHLAHWKRFLLDAWDDRPTDFRAHAARDWPRLTGADEAAWRADVAALEQLSGELIARVRAADEAELFKPLPALRGTLAQHLLGAAGHDAYHAGQILYLRRLQGG